MIQTVSFENFKALRDLTISLERFTVLVGPNASGKTSVLQGLDSLFFLRHDQLLELFPDLQIIATSPRSRPRPVRSIVAAGRWPRCPSVVSHPSPMR